MKPTTLDQARAAKARTLEEFRREATVVVVGVGIARMNGGFGVKVNLEAPPAPDTNLPATVDGVPVRVEVVGKIRKQ